MVNLCNYPKRKKMRLREYDYKTNGYYFITICTEGRRKIFGKVINEKMKLNHLGEQIENIIDNLYLYIPNIKVDTRVVMPNHVHFILILENTRCNEHSVPEIISAFKKYTRKIYNSNFHGALWQKSYYDRIIRDEREYLNIYKYIENNPLKWYFDKYYIT